MTALFPWAFAIVIVYTWIFNRTGRQRGDGHAVPRHDNALAFVADELVPTADLARLLWLWAGLWWLTAIVIVVRGGLSSGADEMVKDETPLTLR